jgi:hypothetical protein
MASGATVLAVGRLADGFISSAAAGSTETLSLAANRLDAFPASFGAWSSTPGTISEQEQQVACIDRYIRRDYHNADSGYQIGMTLLCGPAGPMAVHPPTACFEGVGYSLKSGPAIAAFPSNDDSQPDEFNMSKFEQRSSSLPHTVRAFWGWGQGQHWTAPSQPRMVFRGQSWLYKLYVTDRTIVRSGSTLIPQAESFLKEALPILRSTLSSSTAPATNINPNATA